MGFLRRKRRTDNGAADGDGVESVETYLDARTRVLALAAEQLGAAALDSRVLALVMESRFRSSVWAIVGQADGTTSLYFDGGRRILGAGADERVVAATRTWLESCDELFAHLTAVGGDPPLPELGTTAFFAVTPEGVFGGLIPHAELNEHPLLGLWTKGEGVRREVLRWTLHLRGKDEVFAP